jgi:hypothetical protein
MAVYLRLLIDSVNKKTRKDLESLRVLIVITDVSVKIRRQQRIASPGF